VAAETGTDEVLPPFDEHATKRTQINDLVFDMAGGSDVTPAALERNIDRL